MAELAPLLHLDATTVTGRTLGEDIAAATVHDRDVIRSLGEPLGPPGGLAVVRGSLAPDGAVLKVSAASPGLLQHRGRAVVFDDIHDLLARIDDPDLEVDESSVMVLRGSGPRGGPGMPEWGMLPIPRKLLDRGVTDLVRISDARMSGTGFGTVVLHVAPESAAGGPLGAVRDGDEVVLDVDGRRLDLLVPEDEVARRLAETPTRPAAYGRGYGALFLEHVLQAETGADFDLLRRRPGEQDSREPLGLLEGWITGW
jgi:dihydroxy-acid dehydratase